MLALMLKTALIDIFKSLPMSHTAKQANHRNVRMRCCRVAVVADADRGDWAGRADSAGDDRDDGNDDGTGLMFRSSSEHWDKSSVDVDLACLLVCLLWCSGADEKGC